MHLFISMSKAAAIRLVPAPIIAFEYCPAGVL